MRPVTVTFLPDQITITAKIGEAWLDVAHRAGVEIPTGCLAGSCGACEVDLLATTDQIETCRTCISSVPPGHACLTVQCCSDPSW